MTHRLLFSCLIALCALAFQPFVIRAEETAPAPVVTAPATKALPKYAKAQLGENRFTTFQIEWALGPANRILSGSLNGFVRLWDISTQKMVWEIQTEKQVTPAALVFSGKDEALVVLENGTVLVLNLKDGTEVRRFQIKFPNPFMGSWQYTDAKIAKDMLVTASRTAEGEGALQAWSLKDGAPLQTLEVQNISEVALSPDASQVAWMTVQDFNLHEAGERDTHSIRTAFIAPMTKLESAAKVFEERSAEEIYAYYDGNAFNDSPDLLVFSPDGATLAHASLSGVRLWGVSGGVAKDLRTCPTATPTEAQIAADEVMRYTTPLPSGVVFSEDGKHLLVNVDFSTTGRDVYSVLSAVFQYDAATGAVAKPPADVVWAANPSALPVVEEGVMTPQRPKAFFAGMRFAGVYLPEQFPIGHSNAPHVLAVSPTGAHVATASYDPSDPEGGAPKMIVWTPNAKQVGLEAGVGLLFWLSDTTLVTQDLLDSNVMAGQESNIWVWDVAKQKHKASAIESGMSVVAALPSGEWIGCIPTSYEGVEGRFQRLKKDFAVDSAVKYSAVPKQCPNVGEISAATGQAVIEVADSTFAVVDLMSGKSRLELPARGVLSPDGKSVAIEIATEGDAATYTLEVRDVKSGETRLRVSQEDYLADVNSPSPLILFSSDNSALLYVFKNELRIHARTKDGAWSEKAFVLAGHALPIARFAWSGDTKTLVTIQNDGLMYAWDWPAIQAAAVGVGP